MTAEQKLIEAAENAAKNKYNKDYDVFAAKMNMFIDGAKSQAAKEWHQQWIPVSERKPENTTYVLCYGKGNRRFTALYKDGVFIDYEGEESEYVTHWVSLLPSPPETNL